MDDRLLRALLAAARRPAPPDDEALAAWVVDRRLGHAPAEDDGHAWIEAAFRERPELRRRIEAMAGRLDALAAAAEDPATQFARLTGRLLPDPDALTTRRLPTTSS